MPRFSGIYPILYAFYNADGSLDHAAMAHQVEVCIAAGAHGIAVLGLVTEVHRMDVNERREVVEVVGKAIAGRVPYAVTVGENSVHGQAEFSRMAVANGADWVILQPPSTKGYSEAQYVSFLSDVASRVEVPVAIQNNPVNMDVFLTNASLISLQQSNPNISLLKGEGAAVQVEQLISASAGKFDVFAGHGGKEHLTNMQSGCVGLIPAPDCLDVQLKIHQLFLEGRIEEAEQLHATILPLIIFMTQSVPTILCYGKRLFAQRAGISNLVTRAPEMVPTEFGKKEVARMARTLGRF